MASHEILGGLVQVYKRGTGRYWQCAASIAGDQHRETTKEEDLPQAKQFAEDWYLGLRGKARAGLLKSREKTFREAAKAFTEEYEIITEGERSPKWVEGHQIRLRLHLLPFFGDKGLSEVNEDTAQEYRVYRITGKMPGEETAPGDKAAPRRKPPSRSTLHDEANPINGKKPGDEAASRGPAAPAHKPPSRSTLHDEIVTLRQVLKTAVRKRWLSHLPNLSPPYKTQGKVAHRPWFSPDEYKQLYKATRQYAHDCSGMHRQWNAEQVHDYVLFMANTGLRPDEAMPRNLEHRDVRIVEDQSTGERILEIDVRGKRGVGYCKSMPGAVKVYERLLARALPGLPQGKRARKRRGESLDNPPVREKAKYPQPTDPVFPGNHIKLFNGLLDRNKLKYDREGRPRTAYSLRHTYICMRLIEGADIYALAKNCRTSVEMIQKHYAAHIKDLLDTSLINVRRPKSSRGGGPQKPLQGFLTNPDLE
jgi:integrase